MPDLCIFYNSIHRVKHRQLIMKGNSFGTCYNANKDKSTTSWNIFEHAPIENLDEHSQL